MAAADALRFPYRGDLREPVVGLEAEFRLFVDDVEQTPEEYFRTPTSFIRKPTLRRGTRSAQLPTGGAVYFDGGVIEVVTPVVELGPHSTARVVRSLWEQIGFVRTELDAWEQRTGVSLRLEAFSLHFNISFELDPSERTKNRTIQKLATLLAEILPLPLIVIGANPRSSGAGVRPRRDRIEITFDFITDPGLMAAATALVTGVVREVISWPSYLREEAERRAIPRPLGIAPGRHATRNGWVARAAHFPHDPFTTPLDAQVWQTADGAQSAREITSSVVERFRASILGHSDRFSMELLEKVARGELPSQLDLSDRPQSYADIGRIARWGETIPELLPSAPATTRRHDPRVEGEPPWRGEPTDRRRRVTLPPRIERRSSARRGETQQPPVPRLTRSRYETVFRNLGQQKRIRFGSDLLTPLAVRGWYHVVMEDESGREHLLSIDQLADDGQWKR